MNYANDKKKIIITINKTIIIKHIIVYTKMKDKNNLILNII